MFLAPKYLECFLPKWELTNLFICNSYTCVQHTLSLDSFIFQVISFPCRPCIPGVCVEYACNRSCTDVDPYLVPFTFHNLSLLPGYYTNLNQSDARNMEFESTNENQANTMFSLLSTYFQPSVYYLTVRAITASGQMATSSSNGVTIDTSPPELASPIEHFDVSFPQMEATIFQGSESTISARWRFSDPESGVVEHRWAIGTYPFGQDVQRFEPTGMATEATNSNLLGILRANATYYVTVLATNGAGLTRNATSGGVTVITEELNLTSLERFVEVEAIDILTVPGENGTEVEVWRNDQEDRVSIKWEGISDDVVEVCESLKQFKKYVINCCMVMLYVIISWASFWK